MGKREITLSAGAPLGDFIAGAGLTAHALGVLDAAAQSATPETGRASAYKAVGRGGGVSVELLARYLAAAGYELRLVAVPKGA
jgi:hypothetical protein